MEGFIKVGLVSDIRPGQGMSYNVGEKIVGVFNVDDRFYAINDLCPHAGASLSAGHLDGCVVACPWHGWRFDVTDGTWCDNRKLKVDRYEVRLVDDEIWVSEKPVPEKSESESESPPEPSPTAETSPESPPTADPATAEPPTADPGHPSAGPAIEDSAPSPKDPNSAP